MFTDGRHRAALDAPVQADPPGPRSPPSRVPAWLVPTLGVLLVAVAVLVWASAARHLRGPPAPAAPAAGAAPSGSAGRAPAATGPSAVSRGATLYAGRPPAAWEARLRDIERLPGPEAQRLRALTLRRASGLGLRQRDGEGGTTLEPVASGEGR